VYILESGLQALAEYLSGHVLSCLVPAFFIAGGIASFVSQAGIIKYFGAGARRVVAYSVASVSGAILAVCSCTILPLFAGINKRGAGLGPAITFLYAGPAINILAIVYTARLLGFDLGLARAVFAIAFSVVIGLLMAALFPQVKANPGGSDTAFALPVEESTPLWRTVVFFSVMVGILVIGAAKLWIPALALLAVLLVILRYWYRAGEIKGWLGETWWLAKRIIPILLVGVFVAGMVKALLPQEVVSAWLGGNGLRSNLVASLFGALMYFSTLTEVPIIKALTELGMGKGPALALLLAGPSLSVPNMIVIGRIIGLKRTAVYVILVVIFSALVGSIFGTATR
jgi:uncharacterized membrane protein YraQ (UPF0718 family)